MIDIGVKIQPWVFLAKTNTLKFRLRCCHFFFKQRKERCFHIKKFLNESNRIVNIRNDSKVTILKSVLHSSSGKKKQINMTNTLKVTEFSAAVRGYHYYGCIWFPEKEEQLDCSQILATFLMFLQSIPANPKVQ